MMSTLFMSGTKKTTTTPSSTSADSYREASTFSCGKATTKGLPQFAEFTQGGEIVVGAMLKAEVKMQNVKERLRSGRSVTDNPQLRTKVRAALAYQNSNPVTDVRTWAEDLALWQFRPGPEIALHCQPCWNAEVEEIRTFQSIPPDKLWWVAQRIPQVFE